MPQVPDLPANAPQGGPNAAAFSEQLATRLQAALAARGQDYVPRTRHRLANGSPRFVNRLLLETSPYLQQHAHNPVNWFPWSEEAFAVAKAGNKPVLLSIGYSTCHWCHVMEEESFEDEAIAAYLNAHYVAIKVDREERLDVDAVYMACVQAWNGRGGWPMTVWLTPERKPFFGGTYFPAQDGQHGTRTGLATLLTELKAVYHERPDAVRQAGSDVIKAIQQSLQSRETAGSRRAQQDMPNHDTLARAYVYYQRNFDRTHGGTIGAPKFPSHMPIPFLLRYAQRVDPSALALAVTTLDHMAAGGIHDQIGGGFHRYSVDDAWRVPHFEKMLYDNAQLAVSYLEGWQATGNADYSAVVRSTLNYVRREMTAPAGGFYAATDADSPNPQRGGVREEGWFFTWTPAEFAAVLGPDLAAILTAYYAVEAGGNFAGRSVLRRSRSAAAVAAQLGQSEDDVLRAVRDGRALLYAARSQRPAPLRDDKIITAWNGLMISAFARAGLALRAPEYTETAARAAAFLLRELQPEGRLRRCYSRAPSATPAFLEDYALLIQGLLDLCEARFAPQWLESALQLLDAVQSRFAAADGGYYTVGNDGEALLIRERPTQDGALPAGHSVMALNLQRLAAMTGRDDLRALAAQVLAGSAALLERAPAALATMLVAVDFSLQPATEIVLVTPDEAAQSASLDPFLSRMGSLFLPNRVLLAGPASELAAKAALLPLLGAKPALDGRTTAYICSGATCKLAHHDPAAFAAELTAAQGDRSCHKQKPSSSPAPTAASASV